MFKKNREQRLAFFKERKNAASNTSDVTTSTNQNNSDISVNTNKEDTPINPFKAIDGSSNLVIDKDGYVTDVGNVVAEKLSEDAKTKDDVQAAYTVGQSLNEATNSIIDDEKKKAEEKAKAEMDAKVKDAWDIAQMQTTSNQLLSRRWNGLSNAEQASQSQETPVTPAVGSAISTAVGDDNYRPLSSYGLTEEEKQYFRTSKPSPKSAPIKQAIEQLGVNDYFPDIQQGTIAGSYSRSMLGSGNIYVAGGGVLPYRVLDARRRAQQVDLEKAKEAKDALFKSTHAATATQYQEGFDQEVDDVVNGYLEAAGDNPEVLLDMSTELGRKFNTARNAIQTKAKGILEVSNLADGIIKNMPESNAVFYPEEVQSLAQEIQNGTNADVEAYMSGKVNLFELKSRLKAYNSHKNWAEATMKDLKFDERPLDMTQKGLKKATSIEQLYSKNGAGTGYDVLQSGSITFVDPSRITKQVDGYFDGLINSGAYVPRNADGTINQDELLKLKVELTKYMLALAPEQVKTKQETVSNKEVEERIRRDNMYRYEQDRTTYYTKWEDDAKSFAEQEKAIMNDPKLSTVQKAAKIKTLWSSKYNTYENKNFNVTGAVLPVVSNEGRSINPSNTLFVYKVKEGGKWYNRNISAQELGTWNLTFDQNGKITGGADKQKAMNLGLEKQAYIAKQMAGKGSGNYAMIVEHRTGYTGIAKTDANGNVSIGYNQSYGNNVAGAKNVNFIEEEGRLIYTTTGSDGKLTEKKIDTDGVKFVVRNTTTGEASRAQLDGTLLKTTQKETEDTQPQGNGFFMDAAGY